MTAEQIKQAEELYRAAYHPRQLTPIYHTITDHTTLKRGRILPDYLLFPSQLYPRERPNKQSYSGRQSNNKEPQDDLMDDDMELEEIEGQEDEEESDAEAEDDSANGGDETSKVVAPFSQPITPLQLPTIRPTLLLGPYDSWEQARAAATEYAIHQGYMLIQQGCARMKGARGAYVPGAPIIRMDLVCDRGGSCRNVGTGKRPKSTHKLGCPARMKLLCRKRDDDKWFIEPQCEYHNHDLQPDNMESIASYRRWRRAQAGIPTPETRREQYHRLRGNPVPLPPLPPKHSNGATGQQTAQQPLPGLAIHQQMQGPPEVLPQAAPPPTSPLHMAALKGQLKIMQILLDKGAEVDALDSTGRTALHCAIEGSRTDAVQMLVQRGANVSQPDGKGLSPLRLAVEKGMEEGVMLLIERGADPNR